MNSLVRTILLSAIIFFSSLSLWATSNIEQNVEKNYFQFAISEYHTTRQSGQIVSILVRYAYKKELSTSDYPDYRVVRTKILNYMEPSDAFPSDVFWEILATNMGKELMRDFPLDGVSIQLNVLDNQNPDSYEPGEHGPTFTLGNIAPIGG